MHTHCRIIQTSAIRLVAALTVVAVLPHALGGAPGRPARPKGSRASSRHRTPLRPQVSGIVWAERLAWSESTDASTAHVCTTYWVDDN